MSIRFPITTTELTGLINHTHHPHILQRNCYSAALLYFALMMYIVLGILNEARPVWYYVLAAVLFILSQLDYFLLSKVICNVRTFVIPST